MLENLDLLRWLLVGIPAFYLGVPLQIRFQQRYPANPLFTILDFTQLSLAKTRFLMNQTEALYKLGFDEPTLVQVVDAAPNVTSYLIMLVNRQTGDKAMVTVIMASGLVPLQTAYLEFTTRFDSGDVFDTHNAPELPAFPPGPQKVRTQVPTVRDPQELYQLHTFVMGRHAPSGQKVLYEPGQALDYLTRFAFIKSYEDQAERGWLYYDQRGDVYRPTFKGAYLMTWGLLQPFKGLRRVLLRRRERKVLEEFEREKGTL